MTPNRVAALILIAFSLWYGYLTSQLEKTEMMGETGSRLLPWILTIFLLILSVALLVQDLRGKALPKRFDFKITSGGVKAVTMFVLTFAYQFVMPYIGFVISSILFFGSLMWLGGDRRPIRLLGYSCGLSLLLYFFFKELFQIPLPVWGDLLGGLF